MPRRRERAKDTRPSGGTRAQRASAISRASPVLYLRHASPVLYLRHAQGGSETQRRHEPVAPRRNAALDPAEKPGPGSREETAPGPALTRASVSCRRAPGHEAVTAVPALSWAVPAVPALSCAVGFSTDGRQPEPSLSAAAYETLSKASRMLSVACAIQDTRVGGFITYPARAPQLSMY